ncbi:MAG: sugar phosphate isomerase/epimerase [Verrucomicrobia bacterium]|nr:sugar phosphate isomerase/epimerase [Verrucomicrobiota bacterium]
MHTRPMKPASFSRRQFLATSAASAALAFTETSTAFAQQAAAKRFPLIAFSKPFQQFSADDTADFVAEVGWDGIECPVRAKGQIEPERVEDELPKMVEAMKKRGRDVAIITTDVKNPGQPLTQKVLRTAAKLGIKRYRLAFWKYTKDRPIPAQLADIKAELRDLAALNKELGLQAGFQNHSGADMVGAPVWDIYELIRDLDPKLVGICFDIGHATIEGGYSWPTQARLMEPHLTAVFVKDFIWKKTDKGWAREWCQLGNGAVNKAFFQTLKKSAYAGPISQHHEYPVPADRKAMLAMMKQDLQVLREWLA